MKKIEITKEKLIEFGFQMTPDNPIIICEKVLSDPIENEDDEEDGDIAIVLTRERNINEFAISTPDGTLFLNCDLEQLAIIENTITGYSRNY